MHFASSPYKHVLCDAKLFQLYITRHKCQNCLIKRIHIFIDAIVDDVVSSESEPRPSYRNNLKTNNNKETNTVCHDVAFTPRYKFVNYGMSRR